MHTKPRAQSWQNRLISSCHQQSGKHFARPSTHRRSAFRPCPSCSPNRAYSMSKEKAPLGSPALLDATHEIAAFNCGVPALDNFLKKFALQNLRSQSARTYVATRARRVVGYYTLAAASVRRDETPARVA